MNRQELVAQIRAKKSFLCVGLDTEWSKIPKHLLDTEDPIFEFNKAIIDATKDYCVAYKPNIAFYEAQGIRGWQSLQKTLDYIPKNIFTIADAKRGDIGNTSRLYAQTFFETYDFDSVTVAPYMGEDSVSPFLQFEKKWVILLGLTSNIGSADFQLLRQENGRQLYQEVLEKAQAWGTPDNLMFVIGATQGEHFKAVREIAKAHFFLVPGVGAQGGDLATVARYGMNQDVGLLVNSSRAILYAGNDAFFAEAAAQEAQKVQTEMAGLM